MHAPLNPNVLIRLMLLWGNLRVRDIGYDVGNSQLSLAPRALWATTLKNTCEQTQRFAAKTSRHASNSLLQHFENGPPSRQRRLSRRVIKQRRGVVASVALESRRCEEP